MGQSFVVVGDSMFSESGDSACQVDSVAEDYGGDDQIEPAGAVALILEGAVAQVAPPVEEHGARECISGLALV